ncbi:unnamed protein product [Ixodes pacificus]
MTQAGTTLWTSQLRGGRRGRITATTSRGTRGRGCPPNRVLALEHFVALSCEVHSRLIGFKVCCRLIRRRQ